MPSDELLVEQAEVVVVGTVVQVAPAGGGLPLSELAVRVESGLKGAVAAPEMRVRVLGGPAKSGRRLIVRGAPSFRVGERVLLFLVRHPDGAWRPLHLALGVFHERRAAGRRLAVRDLADAQVLAPNGEPGEEPARDFAAFSRWVGERARGHAARPDYAVAPPADRPAAVAEPYSYLGGQKYRWLEFALGQDVSWFAHEDGQPGVAGGGFAEFQAAIAAWNDDWASGVRYRYDGSTTASLGFVDFDDVNAILFEDPNDEVGGTFTCSSPGEGSGVLAIGGAWSDGNVVGGALVIVGGDIVVNDGAGCWFSTPKRAEQVYGHELGHTLGLGHSDVPQALMRAFAYADDRGAALNYDDRTGVASLYPASTSFFTLPPCRVFDSRRPVGPTGGPALTSLPRSIHLAGPVSGCGVPVGALAAAVNLTVTGATGGGYLSFWGADNSLSSATAISFAAGQTRANNAVVALSYQFAGMVVVGPVLAGNGEVHLIVDVVGYFR